MACPKCDHKMESGGAFCTNCGANIQQHTSICIGRDAGNDVVQDYSMVSGRHCRIIQNGRECFIEDLKSTNGTFVDGTQIPPFVKTPVVMEADTIHLGTHRLDPNIVMQSLAGPPKTSIIPFPRLAVGRGEDNDIILDYPQVSREHASVENEGGRWILTDLGSANGTFVNDRSRKIDRCEITADDTLYFGSYKFPARRLLNTRRHTAFGRPDPANINIENAETVFGRDPKATIHLDYPQVSWHHAKLINTEKGFYLEDLDSSNGTFVNGKRITACYITPEDNILLGSHAFKLTLDNQIVKRDYRGDIRLDADQITFEVEIKKQNTTKKILNNISLSIYPSEFVGLMGPAGSGKTTLMLALNGYLPPSRGRSFINGQSLYENYDAFRGCIGYVPQDDIVHRELTVYEALYYTAKLRLPSDTSDQEISVLIEKTMTELGLIDKANNLDIRDVVIGSPEKKGISGGQKRRVMLAMELLTDPSLLFLDEPTSGLSAQDALIVMDILRKLSDKGKTILLTIHQPSLEIYKKMDNVIIVSSGKLMYYGPTHPDSLTFFNPDRPRELTVQNADAALKGLSERPEDEWRDSYLRSEYHKVYVEERKCEECITDLKPDNDQHSSKASELRQWWTLTRRYFTVKRKDTANTLILLAQAPVIAVLIGMVFNCDNVHTETPLFLLVISALWFGTSNSAPEIVAEKAIFERERMVNLKILPYVFSKYAVLGLLCLIQCAILVGVVHPWLDMNGAFSTIFGIVFLSALAGQSIGLFLSSVTKTQQAAIAIVPLVLLPMMILGGGIHPIKRMETTALKLSYIVPSRWAFEKVIHIEQEGIDKNPDGPAALREVYPLGDFSLIERFFGKHKQESWVMLIVLNTFIIGFLGASMAVIKSKDQV